MTMLHHGPKRHDGLPPRHIGSYSSGTCHYIRIPATPTQVFLEGFRAPIHGIVFSPVSYLGKITHRPPEARGRNTLNVSSETIAKFPRRTSQKIVPVCADTASWLSRDPAYLFLRPQPGTRIAGNHYSKPHIAVLKLRPPPEDDRTRHVSWRPANHISWIAEANHKPQPPSSAGEP